ncbi:HNH endonuclease [Mesorhizobium sp. ES1-4]|uniref:HNH endonuclease n=1 Tax=Mesorhizobium sp. ES1-4 TaxID=2876627 RepID=UPI001CCF84F8|nr:HNH endonuclease [Mesorhizobium sp. ES1-4]MBZ9795573.1 HNH endonuclease [Mesorhizobium sp. ES1-4]
MIQLIKGIEPAILAANAATWTEVLTDKLAAGEVPTPAEKTRYRNPQIKNSLVAETHGKCAYCESKLQHIHHGDVEHIYPKSLDPEQTFVWQNLTLACEICNQNKSDLDPYLEHIIDPYALDPEGHLIFHGGLVFARGTPEGVATLALLKLHRAELVEMRDRHVEKIMGIYAQILDTTLPRVVRQALYDDLTAREGVPHAPYAAMARCVMAAMKPILPADLV